MSKRGDRRTQGWAFAQQQADKQKAAKAFETGGMLDYGILDEDEDNIVDPPEHHICSNCHERPGTIQWVGEGGFLALSHGWYQWWCEVCATKAQIEYAKARAAVIPDLEAKLAELEGNG